MSKETFDELFIRKHLKMQSSSGKIDIHSSGNVLGMFFGFEGSNGMDGDLSIVVQDGIGPYISLWPKSDYWDKNVKHNKLPFAFSGQGLQVPHPDGSITILGLREISTLVKGLVSSKQ